MNNPFSLFFPSLGLVRIIRFGIHEFFKDVSQDC